MFSDELVALFDAVFEYPNPKNPLINKGVSVPFNTNELNIPCVFNFSEI
jgi:hypothetical protein